MDTAYKSPTTDTLHLEVDGKFPPDVFSLQTRPGPAGCNTLAVRQGRVESGSSSNRDIGPRLGTSVAGAGSALEGHADA